MPSFTSRLTGIFELALSVIGAAMMIFQTITGADGIAQIGAALVTLIAPVCAAIRANAGAGPQDVIQAVTTAVTDTLNQADTAS